MQPFFPRKTLLCVAQLHTDRHPIIHHTRTCVRPLSQIACVTLTRVTHYKLVVFSRWAVGSSGRSARVYNFAFKMMNFAFKMMDFVFKMMNFGRRQCRHIYLRFDLDPSLHRRRALLDRDGELEQHDQEREALVGQEPVAVHRHGGRDGQLGQAARQHQLQRRRPHARLLEQRAESQPGAG